MSMIYGFVPEAPLGGNPLVAGLVIIVGFLLGLRVCHGVRRRRQGGERVLIVGASALGRHVVEEIERRPYLRYDIVGVVEKPRTSVASSRRPGPIGSSSRSSSDADACRSIRSLSRGRAESWSRTLPTPTSA